MSNGSGKDVWFIQAGPVGIGGVTERKPETKSDRTWKIVTWLITVALIASAAPMLGVILILVGAMLLAAAGTDEGNSHDRTQHPAQRP